jgi:hypothetical protein
LRRKHLVDYCPVERFFGSSVVRKLDFDNVIRNVGRRGPQTRGFQFRVDVQLTSCRERHYGTLTGTIGRMTWDGRDAS